MISFTCPRCNLGYQYPDDMAGQKIRCTGPNCNQKLLIPAPTEQPTMVAPITASGPAERRWNYLENGQTKGPVAAAELKRLVAGGRLIPKDPVWTTGMGDWLPLHEALPQLFRRPSGVRRRKADDEASGERWGAFEKIGIGVFAVVAAVILVGLFMILFPLIRSSAAHTQPNLTATANPGDGAKPAVQEMKPQDVTALCKPSVALIRNRGASGSGFLVDGGFVVTNSHVVADDAVAALVLTFPSSDLKAERYKARLVYEDRHRDLAILQLQDPPSLAPLPLCAAKPAEGEDVLAIGSPGIPGIDGGVSTNSADKGTLGNPNFRQSGDDLVYIQHSAKINHGNSGGPLLNMRGEVIGVNVAIIIQGPQGPIDGVKLAIPVADLRAILDKAASRNSAAIDHATVAHDAYNIAKKLEDTLELYHVADQHCVNMVFDAGKQNKNLTEAFYAAQNDIAAGKVKAPDGKRTLPNPVLYRQDNMDPQWAEFNDLLSGSSLDDQIRGKLRQLREMYLKVKNIYEAPSGTFGDMRKELDTIRADCPKLEESLDAEFGSVF